MSLKNLATSADIANEKDSVGGGGAIDSGLFTGTVTLAYLSLSKGGANALNVHIKDASGKELRQQFWVTSGTAKGGKHYYEKDGVKNYLPGFLMANSLCLLTVGKEISELDTEEKVVKLYSYDAKAEVPTKVQVLTDLIGQEIIAGVLKQVVDKNIKNDAGDYVPSGETREVNEVDKFFRAKDRKTSAEIRAQEDASFIDTWDKKYTGQVINKATGAAAGGTAGAPKKPGAAAAAPKASLFG